MTIALGLGFVVSVWGDLVPGYPTHAADWCIVTVGLMAGLWLLWRWLPNPTENWTLDSGNRSIHLQKRDAIPGAMYWRSGCWCFMSLALAFLYAGLGAPPKALCHCPGWLFCSSGPPLLGAVSGHYGLLCGWAVELLVAQLLAWQEPVAVHLAVPTLGLGVFALILAVAIRQAWPLPWCRLCIASRWPMLCWL